MGRFDRSRGGAHRRLCDDGFLRQGLSLLHNGCIWRFPRRGVRLRQSRSEDDGDSRRGDHQFLFNVHRSRRFQSAQRPLRSWEGALRRGDGRHRPHPRRFYGGRRLGGAARILPGPRSRGHNEQYPVVDIVLQYRSYGRCINPAPLGGSLQMRSAHRQGQQDRAAGDGTRPGRRSRPIQEESFPRSIASIILEISLSGFFHMPGVHTLWILHPLDSRYFCR